MPMSNATIQCEIPVEINYFHNLCFCLSICCLEKNYDIETKIKKLLSFNKTI